MNIQIPVVQIPYEYCHDTFHGSCSYGEQFWNLAVIVNQHVTVIVLIVGVLVALACFVSALLPNLWPKSRIDRGLTGVVALFLTVMYGVLGVFTFVPVFFVLLVRHIDKVSRKSETNGKTAE